MTGPEVVIREGPSDLAIEAADFIAQEIQGSQADPFLLALTGGSTPAATYRELSERPVDWSRVHFLLGDERHIPADDENSNYRQARETLLDPIKAPSEQVHRVPTELPPDEAAAAYERTIRSLRSKEEVPRIDLVLLGLGSNGHVASIFPGEPEIDEADRLVVATRNALATDAGPPLRRITFTFRLINAARAVAFIVSGERKAPVVAAALRRERPREITASNVQPEGRLVWLLDRPAASAL